MRENPMTLESAKADLAEARAEIDSLATEIEELRAQRDACAKRRDAAQRRLVETDAAAREAAVLAALGTPVEAPAAESTDHAREHSEMDQKVSALDEAIRRLTSAMSHAERWARDAQRDVLQIAHKRCTDALAKAALALVSGEYLDYLRSLWAVGGKPWLPPEVRAAGIEIDREPGGRWVLTLAASRESVVRGAADWLEATTGARSGPANPAPEPPGGSLPRADTSGSAP